MVLSLYFIGLSTALCGTIDPDTPDSRYIEFGKQFHYVGKIHGTSNDSHNYQGSCVAHDSNIVITAAHILEEAKDAFVDINNRTIKITNWIIHPKYNKKDYGPYDIAIGITESSMGLEWYPDLYINNDESNKVCSLSGYGMTGTFSTMPHKYDSNRRAGSNVIDGITNEMLYCSPSVSYSKTPLEFLTASGDSGGGLFIGNKLAGIHSTVIRPAAQSVKTEYSTISTHTRISLHHEWIKNNMKELNNAK